MKENIKLLIFQGIATVFIMLALIFTFALPAFFLLGGERVITTFEMIINAHEDGVISGGMLFGLILLFISLLASTAIVVLLLIKKDKPVTIMILGIISGICALASGLLLGLGYFVSGLSESNPIIGLNQGEIGFMPGTFLVLGFAIIGFVLSFLISLIATHHFFRALMRAPINSKKRYNGGEESPPLKYL